MGLEIHPRSFGVTGVKCNFHQECYFPYSLHGITMRLRHIHQLDTHDKNHGSENLPEVIWGHRGQMVIFNKKWYNLLEPLCLCQMPTRGHLGSNLDFQVNCNISFVLYHKIIQQDLCRSNDTMALVIIILHTPDL